MKNGCRIRIPRPRKPLGHCLSHQNPKKARLDIFDFAFFMKTSTPIWLAFGQQSANNWPTFHQHLQLCENGQHMYSFSNWLFSAPRSPFAASERLLASSLSWLSDDTIELGWSWRNRFLNRFKWNSNFFLFLDSKDYKSLKKNYKSLKKNNQNIN